MRTKYLASFALAALTTAATGAAPAPDHAEASITGKVTFTGTPPKMRPIDMAKEPTCASQHPSPVMTEAIVSGAGNSVQNVVVYITAGDQGSTPPAGTAHYSQKGCQYIPHVLALQTGQPLEVTNEDQTSHNIHPLATVNPEWNKSQPAGAAPLKATYGKPEFIAVKCNVHPWMHGYFAVLGTSHFAVTGNDGQFSIAGLAPGKYVVTAWHEKFGTLSQEVTVPATGDATANFQFKALPY